MHMNVTAIVNKLSNYLDQELHYTRVHLINEADPIARDRICWLCLQRCLGACQYAEMLGVQYETIEALYNAQREKLQLLEAGA